MVQVMHTDNDEVKYTIFYITKCYPAFSRDTNFQLTAKEICRCAQAEKGSEMW